MQEVTLSGALNSVELLSSTETDCKCPLKDVIHGKESAEFVPELMVIAEAARDTEMGGRIGLR